MKKRFVLILLLTLPVHTVVSQTGEQPHSIHWQEWEAHRHLPKMPSLFDSTGRDIEPLAMGKRQLLQRAVFGYLPDWQYKSARSFLQYDLLSHLAAFDFTVNSSGYITNPSYWPWTDVINAAHNEGVKVIMVAVNFNRDAIHTLLTDASAKNNFFRQAKTKINQYKLDGINVDFEGLYSADRGSLLNNFMKDLTDYMHREVPGSEVSFAGPAVNWGGWDLAGLANSCDYIFIMGYAFYGSWSSTSGPGAPLTGGSYNITNTVTVQYAQVTENHPEKLILGVPYYGTRWQTADNRAYSSTVDYINHPRFVTAIKEGENYGLNWDGKSQTPWYAYQIGNDWYQVWFDSRYSLGLKYDLADTKNLRGVGMWALGYDLDRSDLWNELRVRYAPGTVPLLPDRPDGLIVRAAGEGDLILVDLNLPEFADGFYLYWAKDRQMFRDSLFFPGSRGYVTGLDKGELYFLKVRCVNSRSLSPYSAIMAATTTGSPRALIVDGFQRNEDGHNRFNYAVPHAWALYLNGYFLATVQTAAVQQGLVDLNDFELVDWYLGDESTVDFTFNTAEKEIVRDYLEHGGHLLVSGSEIGWDLVAKGSQDDRDFYRDYLKAEYMDDAPLGQAGTYYRVEPVAGTIFSDLPAFSFDDGSHGSYDVDWPDAIKPAPDARLGLRFSGVSADNGGCAVFYQGPFGSSDTSGRLVYLSFPFESVVLPSDRTALMADITQFLSNPTSVADVSFQPQAFRLEQNYPNPFGSGNANSTTIRYRIGQTGHVRLTVYNSLGQVVRTLVNKKQRPGRYSAIFNAVGLANGFYFYKLTIGDRSRVRRMLLLR